MACRRIGTVVTAILAIIIPLAVSIIGATWVLSTRLTKMQMIIESVHRRVARIEKKVGINGDDLHIFPTRTTVG